MKVTFNSATMATRLTAEVECDDSQEPGHCVVGFDAYAASIKMMGVELLDHLSSPTLAVITYEALAALQKGKQ